MKEMRRKDREMSRSFAEAVADKCIYAVLSTVNDDGSPYGTALSIVRDGQWIYFHSAKEGRKIDNLRRFNKICLVCVGDVFRPEDKFTVEYESAVIYGTAFEITRDDEKIHALRLLCLRHTPANMADFESAIRQGLAMTAVWKIRIDEISGKRNRKTNG